MKKYAEIIESLTDNDNMGFIIGGNIFSLFIWIVLFIEQELNKYTYYAIGFFVFIFILNEIAIIRNPRTFNINSLTDFISWNIGNIFITNAMIFGITVFGGLFIGMGYIISDNWKEIGKGIGITLLVILSIVGTFGLLYLIKKFLYNKFMKEKIEKTKKKTKKKTGGKRR